MTESSLSIFLFSISAFSSSTSRSSSSHNSPPPYKYPTLRDKSGLTEALGRAPPSILSLSPNAGPTSRQRECGPNNAKRPVRGELIYPRVIQLGHRQVFPDSKVYAFKYAALRFPWSGALWHGFKIVLWGKTLLLAVGQAFGSLVLVKGVWPQIHGFSMITKILGWGKQFLWRTAWRLWRPFIYLDTLIFIFGLSSDFERAMYLERLFGTPAGPCFSWLSFGMINLAYIERCY